MTRHRVLAWALRDPRGRLKRLRLRLTVIPPWTALQKQRLLRRASISDVDAELLRRTDSRIHPYEDMYTGDARHYFSVSISAVRHMEAVLRAANADSPDTILDMPCGFGRVTRSLVARFPGASITACDIRPAAVGFCARRFDAEGIISSPVFEDLSFARAFDLIWCGSLVTHLDAPEVLALIDLFAGAARPGAVIVFTTHGDRVANAISGGVDYLLTAEGVRALTCSYERSGYGYANYPWGHGYGVSVISPHWVRSHVERRGGLREVYFAERSWDSHHDVFGFSKP
jgi:SAM-dependent methyltransferase